MTRTERFEGFLEKSRKPDDSFLCSRSLLLAVKQDSRTYAQSVAEPKQSDDRTNPLSRLDVSHGTTKWREKNGSPMGRQSHRTCAGEYSTYTATSSRHRHPTSKRACSLKKRCQLLLVADAAVCRILLWYHTFASAKGGDHRTGPFRPYPARGVLPLDPSGENVCIGYPPACTFSRASSRKLDGALGLGAHHPSAGSRS